MPRVGRKRDVVRRQGIGVKRQRERKEFRIANCEFKKQEPALRLIRPLRQAQGRKLRTGRAESDFGLRISDF